MAQSNSLLPGLPGNPLPAQGGPQQGGGPQPQGDPTSTGDEDSNVSPEEQAQYSEFEENYMRLIYDGDQVRPDLLEALEAARDGGQSTGDSPPPAVLTLATTAIKIIERIDDAATAAERPISDDVLFHGGVAVIEELAEVAGTANIYDYSEEEMSGALTVAVDMYRDKALSTGRASKEELTGEWDRLIAADREGKADEVVPGIMEAGGSRDGAPPQEQEGR